MVTTNIMPEESHGFKPDTHNSEPDRTDAADRGTLGYMRQRAAARVKVVIRGPLRGSARAICTDTGGLVRRKERSSVHLSHDSIAACHVSVTSERDIAQR